MDVAQLLRALLKANPEMQEFYRFVSDSLRGFEQLYCRETKSPYFTDSGSALAEFMGYVLEIYKKHPQPTTDPSVKMDRLYAAAILAFKSIYAFDCGSSSIPTREVFGTLPEARKPSMGRLETEFFFEIECNVPRFRESENKEEIVNNFWKSWTESFLNPHIEALKAKAKSFEDNNDHREAKKLRKIVTDITAERDKVTANVVETGSISPEVLRTFKQNCNTTIYRNGQSFAHHRGVWGLLTHIAVAIASAFIVPVVSYMSTGSYVLFKPDTAKKLDALQSTVASIR